MTLAFRVVPPQGAGAPFFARIDRGNVRSTRDGKWAAEPRLSTADLMMPEQNFVEWDIHEIPVGDLPADDGP